ncbi:hypothetical protein WDW86_20605 [Bdellovibrionota bacterium FG-2]
MANPKAPSASSPAPTPVAETAPNKIQELKAQVQTLQREVKTLTGKIANRNPATATKVKQENEKLIARVGNLQKALYALTLESQSPSAPAEDDLRTEILRQATLQYCKKANVDQSIWKNIAY